MDLKCEPFVSVVTPFHNTEKYLTQCIQSVIAQRYNNWEYILLNNCSSDDSMEIAKSFAKKDKRIKLLQTKKLLSQVENYNHALKQISNDSKYCKIVQADDWIFPDCLRQMVQNAEEKPTIGIVGSFFLKSRLLYQNGMPELKKAISGREICRLSILDEQNYFGNPTTMLFRSDIVRNRDPFYCKDSYFEDTEACYEVLKNNDFGFVHQILTYIRTENRDESLSVIFSNFDPGYRLNALIHLVKHGPYFLSENEFKKCLTIRENKYYEYLGKQYLFNRNQEFWQFHKKGLKTINRKISKNKIKKYCLLTILNIIFNPKNTIEKLILTKKKKITTTCNK